MKKYLVFLLIFVVAVSLSSCEIDHNDSLGADSSNEIKTGQSETQNSTMISDSDAEHSSDNSNTQDSDEDTFCQEMYTTFISGLKSETSEIRYFIKDLDNNGTQDLIVKNQTVITVYSYQDEVVKLDEYDFTTSTLRLFSSDKEEYPGVFAYTVGGGMDHYSYVSLKDNRLHLEELWMLDYSGVLGEPGAITETSENKGLISESKALYDNNRDILFQ